MSKNKRIVKMYEIKFPCEVTMGRSDIDGKSAFTLYGIVSSDKDENARLGEDGEFSCWDSDVRFINDGIEAAGADGPSGGECGVRLFIPSHLISALLVEEV